MPNRGHWASLAGCTGDPELKVSFYTSIGGLEVSFMKEPLRMGWCEESSVTLWFIVGRNGLRLWISKLVNRSFTLIGDYLQTDKLYLWCYRETQGVIEPSVSKSMHTNLHTPAIYTARVKNDSFVLINITLLLLYLCSCCIHAPT